MSTSPLRKSIALLESRGELIRISEEIDPDQVLGLVQRKLYEKKAPAVLFEKVKGTEFPCLANLYGTPERVRLLLGSSLDAVSKLVQVKADLGTSFKSFKGWLGAPLAGVNALPVPVPASRAPVLECEISLSDLPQIKSWPEDGGAFITLPQVLTQDPHNNGILHSNMGMYRIQISGGEYTKDLEAGMHYQLHRGIGIHHKAALEKGDDLKVSIFVGGPPAHAFAAVMPLPEGMSETTIAGALAGRNFRYAKKGGWIVSADADFCILGSIQPNSKIEGPFGDHLGYYSLEHLFPYLKVHSVHCRKDAIWPFTTVGRPPQEDTVFGELIHEITGPMLPKEIPGVKAVHAVDAAGVHPLLLAVGSERYTPYEKTLRPRELLTQANAILGFGQVSLAKFLFMADEASKPDIHDIPAFFCHILERLDPECDLHFQTCTTMDTLDYSGEGVGIGSKVVIAAAGAKRRSLKKSLPKGIDLAEGFSEIKIAFPGVLLLKGPSYDSSAKGRKSMKALEKVLWQQKTKLEGFPWVVVCDDPTFVKKNLENFLWTAFTRTNPSHDIWGAGSKTVNKHWQCRGALIFDARKKPHHAPELMEDPAKVKEATDFMKKMEGISHEN